MTFLKLSILLSKYRWFVVGIFTLLLRQIATFFPEWVEKAYSRGIFPFIRTFFDTFSSFSPVAFFYVLAFFLVVWGYWWWKKAPQRLPFLLNSMGMVVFLFFFLWGFNYARLPLSKQLGYEKKPFSLPALRQELATAAQEAIEAKAKMTEKDTLQSDFMPQCRADVAQVLRQYHFNGSEKVKGRILAPKGVLMRFGATGVYIPFIGEGNIDAALHPLQQPFTMAHEISHANGWGDEGTCNFFAYLACRQSESAYIRYSGYICYFRYVAGNYKAIAPNEYALFRKTLPTDFIQDLEAMNKNLQDYPDWVSTSAVYEWFLQSQGMEEGLAAYSKVVALVQAWREKG